MPTTTHTGKSDLDRDARDLYAALSDLVRLYQFRDRDTICCHDISVTQCYALQSLERGGAMTLTALADDLMLDKSTTSRVAETLERKGYLRRERHPEDARAMRIEITARGKTLCQRIERDLMDEERNIIESLDPAVRRAAIGVVRDLARLAAARIGRQAACCAVDTEQV
ncbi:MAG TPA: MarR family transcriptional regulator [Candidatus Krumholzibacteria bacterium]|nr:MarR family transcriptional regulator [Candidatus Krumholzibacteria bacterium]